MNIHVENVNTDSNSGPNSFASKLMKYMYKNDNTFYSSKDPDVILSFIESRREIPSNCPLIQRLDGIYFNTTQDYKQMNANIKKTYEKANGVVFQSQFNKELVFKYFGPHENYKIIHNGADVDLIDKTEPFEKSKYQKIWTCASSWRPHKRLNDNINYFIEHSDENDGLIIAGSVDSKDQVKHERIHYFGNLNQRELIKLYKSSDYFLHLAWLDHCPNVVVDARASGCRIICSSTGGTKEIAGKDAIVIQEEEWDFSPLNLYDPPEMDFSKKIDNPFDSNYNMGEVAKKYEDFFISTKRKLDS